MHFKGHRNKRTNQRKKNVHWKLCSQQRMSLNNVVSFENLCTLVVRLSLFFLAIQLHEHKQQPKRNAHTLVRSHSLLDCTYQWLETISIDTIRCHYRNVTSDRCPVSVLDFEPFWLYHRHAIESHHISTGSNISVLLHSSAYFMYCFPKSTEFSFNF